MRAWIPAVAVALGLGALAASLAGAAVARDRRPPSKPHVSGPLSTTNSAPRYRFSAHDNSTPARRLRFRCAFDSPRLHACARVYGASLTLGEHVLRVQALDRAGNHSRTTVVHVLVEPAPLPAHVLATTTVADSAFMTFAADGSVWVNRGPGSQTGTVSRIDPATNQVTATVTVSPPGPNAGGCDIGFGFGSIWVVNLQASSLSRIDPATATVLSTISTETGSGSLPCGVAITPQAVWVAKHEPIGSIVKVDPTTNHIVDEIPVGQPSPVGGLAFIVAAAGSLWGNGPGEVTRLDPASDQVLANISPCAGNGGFKMATDGAAIWSANCTGGDGGISQVDPAGNTIRTVVPAIALAAYITRCTSRCLVPYGVSLTFGGATLWAAGQCGTSTCVLGIDPATDAVVKAWTVPFAGGGTVAYGDGSLWLTGANSVVRIDPGS